MESIRNRLELGERLFWLPLRNPQLGHDSPGSLLDACAAKLLPFGLSGREVGRWACAILNPPEWSCRSPLFSTPKRLCPARRRGQQGCRNSFACAAVVLGQRQPSPVWERSVLPLAHRWRSRVPQELPRADWSSAHTTARAQEAVQ